MKRQVLYLYILAFVLSYNMGYCSTEADADSWFTRIKRSVVNYFYASSNDYPQDDYYVNECGYVTPTEYQYESNFNYTGESCICSNLYPATERVM